MADRILFVDDDEAGRELSLYNLVEAGYEAEGAPDGARALAVLQARGAELDLVVTDLRMPDISGMEVLAEVRRRYPEIPVVVVTAHGSVEIAVQAMKGGAYDFIEKPFSRDVLLMTVARALERRRLTLENRDLRRRAAGIERPIIGESRAMRELLETGDRIAASAAALLITGESGTGKELLARRIHCRSARADGPFVPVNCAVMPADLLESELFGHARGAFTGATQSRSGRFRRAEGGTLFLDEVGEIPPPVQGKLLRVLQEKVVDVLGSDRPVPVDVRVVAATNRSLPDAIRRGGFREDLYYRLNVVELRAPPLRDHLDDLEPLARHFVASAAPDRDLELPDALLAAMRRYPWPGNVRELQNACERLVILCPTETLRVEDLPPAVLEAPGRPAAGAPGGEEWPPLPEDGLSLVDLERRVIERVLQLKRGNVTQSALYLKVPRHVLAYRIQKYGISRG